MYIQLGYLALWLDIHKNVYSVTSYEWLIKKFIYYLISFGIIPPKLTLFPSQDYDFPSRAPGKRDNLQDIRHNMLEIDLPSRRDDIRRHPGKLPAPALKTSK